jgi:hypothetical protein
MDEKQRRRAISNSQRAAIRIQRQTKPNLSNLQLKKWFEDTYQQRINASQISRILSPKYAYLDDIASHRLNDKRVRQESWPQLEDALFEWIVRAEKQITISQEVIREKAKQYWPSIYPRDPMPNFSNGWIRNFQHRRNVRWTQRHGEAGDIAKDTAQEMVRIRQALAVYAPQDIFNCDETGLY